jgi:hypothetical protein
VSVDFSAGTDAFPSVYNAITAWFKSQNRPQVVLDGRFAADILRGTVCLGDTRGSVNSNLLANYFVRAAPRLRCC